MIKICIHGVGKDKERSETVDIADDIKTAPFLTGLAPSSVIEKIENSVYKQNFQVCTLDKSGMWAKIKEYSFKWDEESKEVELFSIGLKILLFRRPIDNNVHKRLNFIPYYSEYMNYIIKGTQLIPIDSNSNNDHVIL